MWNYNGVENELRKTIIRICDKYEDCDDCPLSDCPVEYCSFSNHGMDKLVEIAKIFVDSRNEYGHILEKLKMLCATEME